MIINRLHWRNTLRSLVLALLALHAVFAHAQEPVRRIGVVVEPYYRAAAEPQGRPSVAVSRALDEGLSDNDPARIKEVESDIRAKPEMVSPMTLMVLSIRLYDTGYRDDAVFWHYVAKDRMRTISQIVTGGIAGAVTATRDFAATAGPTINGYAFCDMDKQRRTRRSAIEWVRDHPYKAIFFEQLPSPVPDRAAALRDVIASIDADVQKEAEYLSTPTNAERFQKARADNGADRRYCW